MAFGFSWQSAVQSAAQTISQLIGQDIVARSIRLTQSAGSNAVQIDNQGARLKFSSGGTNDYLKSATNSTNFVECASLLVTPGISDPSANYHLGTPNALSFSGGFFFLTMQGNNVIYVDQTTLDVTMNQLAGTAGTGTVVRTAALRHYIHKITLPFTSVQTGGTTNDIVLWTVPAKTRILRVVADVTTQFSGGAIATCVMRSGNVANGNQYLLDGNVLAAPIVLGDGQAELGAGIVGGTGFSTDMIWASTTPVQCRFTSTGANLSALTQGSVTFYIEACTYPS